MLIVLTPPAGDQYSPFQHFSQGRGLKKPLSRCCSLWSRHTDKQRILKVIKRA